MYVLYVYDVDLKDLRLSEMLYFSEFDHLVSYLKSIMKPNKQFGIRFDPADIGYPRSEILD